MADNLAGNVDAFIFNYQINKSKGDTGIVVSNDLITLTGVRFDIYTGVKTLDKIVSVNVGDLKARRSGLQAKLDQIDAIMADIQSRQ